ncbi:aromatic ring-hydroxylating oxygenase subunit alpha [Solimonas soli]|jgi:phenylpropionate dioxygenase-like ring-hydroxylating dioxygenase large terminal subunit|uniref:aromatic ring-hydroxylating oxygenase subunit alpha n=1 Tax=Solimonas soli TaxID=413479 RepID=UPI0004824FCA|nr:aromatic ring-hydroxylating dioxygenase subunit alpha [Solimonas soli]
MDGDKRQSARRIPKERYLSREFLQREKDRLWPRVWQVACRLEEIPKVGDYVTYDVADETIVVVRTAADRIKAYHNVCPHRGRQLVQGCGHAINFRCPYHGWTFSIEGRNVHVQDRQDYGDTLNPSELDLLEVKLDTWGGFVFVNMDPACEPLAEFLDPLPEYLDDFEFENMRYRWYVTTVMPANWKATLEGFMEGYHVAATHPQLLRYLGDDYTQSYALGKHAHFGYWDIKAPPGMPSPRLKGSGEGGDVRAGVVAFFEMFEQQLAAIWTDRDYEAAKAAMAKAPADIDVITAFGMAVEAGRAAAEAEGAGYPPKLTFEKLARAGSDFHIFPNCVTLPWFDGTLWYRARPNGDDPDSCIFDIWSLKRYAPGKEPPLQRRKVDLKAGDSVCVILDQDLNNLDHITRGMKSRGFSAARPNPVQEVEISHFHSTLDRYLD